MSRPGRAIVPAVWGICVLVGCVRLEADDVRTSVVLAHGPDWVEAWPPGVSPAVPLASSLSHVLEDSAAFRIGGGESALPSIGVVAFSPVVDAAPEGGWRVTLGLTGTAEAGGAPTLVAEAVLPAGPPETLAERWSVALRRATEGLALRHRMRGASDAELVAALAEPTLADAAADRLVERRNPAVLPFLLARLRQEPDDPALRALGGLVALRERSAVRSIVDEAERRSLSFRIQAMHALGALGGEEAEAFLFASDAGDPDVRVRTAARESLSLARRLRGEPVRSTPEARW